MFSKIRLARCFRQSLFAFCDMLKAPFHKPSLILMFLLVPLILFLFDWIYGNERMREELGIILITAFGFVGAYGAYAIFSLIFAPFVAHKKEKEKGSYFGKRFVYHLPMYIYTTVVSPNDNGNIIKVLVKDAEPNTFVLFKIEYDKGMAAVSVGGKLYAYNSSSVETIRKIEHGARLNSEREASFFINCPENSDSTIIRFYILSWDYEGTTHKVIANV